MLEIEYTKSFLKQYSKLNPLVRRKTKTAINKFQKNPKDSSLKSHKLNGILADKYAFSVDHQYRIVFQMNKEKGSFEFLKIGTHQIYK
jgi:addiction module RelE/StbE family toxin